MKAIREWWLRRREAKLRRLSDHEKGIYHSVVMASIEQGRCVDDAIRAGHLAVIGSRRVR